MSQHGRLLKTAQFGQRGAVLLIVLVMVTVLGLAAAKAGQSWRAIMQQAREVELLWRGHQYQKAIESYYNVRHGPQQMYPAKLEDLVRDPRFPGVVRHLRKIYMDPMTNAEFELIKDPAQRIMGVRSTSTLEPFKKDGFSKGLEDLKGKVRYQDWEFVFKPKTVIRRRAGPGATGQPGSVPTNQPASGVPAQGVQGQPLEGGGGQGTIRMPAARKPTP